MVVWVVGWVGGLGYKVSDEQWRSQVVFHHPTTIELRRRSTYDSEQSTLDMITFAPNFTLRRLTALVRQR